MFDIGASELLMIVIVAVVVIGPKDMPMALRTAGRWIGRMRKISGHFRAGVDAMVREAELEEMERKWREQNEAIMKAHPQVPGGDEMVPPSISSQSMSATEWTDPVAPQSRGQSSGQSPGQPASREAGDPTRPAPAKEAEPQLPLPPP